MMIGAIASLVAATGILIGVALSNSASGSTPAPAWTYNDQAGAVRALDPTSTYHVSMVASDPTAATPNLQVSQPQPPVDAITPALSVYQVQKGDSLSTIAWRFGMADFHALYAANQSVIGPNPSLIHAGQVLTVPNV